MSRFTRLSLHAFLAAATLLMAACTHDMNFMEMKALMPVQPADKGRIYFYREFAFLGNIVTPDILLNDESVGTSNPKTFFYVDRDPGDYRVVCGEGPDHGANFSLAAGQAVYIRTAVVGGVVKAQMETAVIDPTTAIPAMRDLKYDSK